MSTIASKSSSRALAALVLLAAVGVGYGVGALGVEVAVLLPVVLGGLAILYRPGLGLLLVVFLIPFENMLLFAGANTATKMLSVVVAGAWFLAKLIERESWERVLGSRVVWAAAVFLAYSSASVLWAELAQPGLPTKLFRMVMLLGLGLLTLDLVRTWDEARWLTRLLVLGGTIGAGLTLFQFAAGGVRRAGGGISGGINATALVLLTIVPFAFALIRGETLRRWRLLGVLYVGLGVTAVALTFSRMSFLVLPVVLAVELWETVRTRRGRTEVLALFAVGAVTFFSLVPIQTIQERIATIGPYIENTLSPSDEALVDRSGRGYHIAVALAIFSENPILGAGFGNYGELFLQYQHQVPGAGQLYESARSPHGNYWGFLADLGVVGILLWLALLLFMFLNLRAAWSELSDDRSSFGFVFIRAVTLVFLIQCVYGAYAEMHVEKFFWIVLGLSVAVRRLAREAGGERLSATAGRRAA